MLMFGSRSDAFGFYSMAWSGSGYLSTFLDMNATRRSGRRSWGGGSLFRFWGCVDILVIFVIVVPVVVVVIPFVVFVALIFFVVLTVVLVVVIAVETVVFAPTFTVVAGPIVG